MEKNALCITFLSFFLSSSLPDEISHPHPGNRHKNWYIFFFPSHFPEFGVRVSVPAPVRSVDLDGGVDLSDEAGGADVAEGAAHDAQAQGEQGHVPEVEHRLEQPIHPKRGERGGGGRKEKKHLSII